LCRAGQNEPSGYAKDIPDFKPVQNQVLLAAEPMNVISTQEQLVIVGEYPSAVMTALQRTGFERSPGGYIVKICKRKNCRSRLLQAGHCAAISYGMKI
jgi:hypothetical protein